MVTWLKKYVSQVKKNEIRGIGLFVIRDGDAKVSSDWLILPGCNKHELVAGAQYLAADVLEYLRREE